MNYFEERVQQTLFKERYIALERKYAIPSVCRLAFDLKNKMADHSRFDGDVFIRLFRSSDKRTVVAFKYRDADSYLILKFFSKNGNKRQKMPVQVVAMKGEEAFFILKAISREIHSFFSELDSYCDAMYSGLHLNYIFDVSKMTGTFVFENGLGEEEMEYDEDTFGGIRF